MRRAKATTPEGPNDGPPLGYRPLEQAQLQALLSATQYALAREAGRSPMAPDLSDLPPAETVTAIYEHRLAAVLEPWLEDLRLPRAVTVSVRNSHHRSSMAAMMIATQTSRCMRVLAEHGVRALAIKGVALAAQSVGDFTARGAGDVDLMIHEDDIEAAFTALATLDLRVELPPPMRDDWRWRYWLRTQYETQLVNSHTRVDLHWALVHHLAPSTEFDELWERRIQVSIDGNPVWTLGNADAFEFACASTYFDSWRWLRSLVDVARMARIVSTPSPESTIDPVIDMTAYVAYREFDVPELLPWCAHSLRSQKFGDKLLRSAQRSQLTPFLDHSRTAHAPTDVWHMLTQYRRLRIGPSRYAWWITSRVMPYTILIDRDSRTPVSPVRGLTRRSTSVIKSWVSKS